MHTFVVAHEPYLPLATSIAHELQLPVHALHAVRFADSEVLVDFKTPHELAGSHAIVVHATARPVNDSLMVLLLTLHMLKQKGVQKITAVIPYFGYARQDVPYAHESVAQYVLRLIRDAGADHAVIVELHNPSMLYNAPLSVTHVSPVESIVQKIMQKEDALQCTIIAPDVGSSERAARIAEKLDVPLVVYEKERYAVNKTRLLCAQGECATSLGIIVDDIIDTGSTLLQVIEHLHELDNRLRLCVVGIHGVLSNDAAHKLQHSPVESVWITNSIARSSEDMPSKFDILDISKEISQALMRYI